jgi:hypothetical protein
LTDSNTPPRAGAASLSNYKQCNSGMFVESGGESIWVAVMALCLFLPICKDITNRMIIVGIREVTYARKSKQPTAQAHSTKCHWNRLATPRPKTCQPRWELTANWEVGQHAAWR